MNSRRNLRGSAPKKGPRRPVFRRAAFVTVAAAAVLALVVSGCGLLLHSPDVDIASVRVTSVGLVGGTAEVELSVVNPNRFTLTAKEVRYRLSFADGEAEGGWRVLTEGESEDEVSVAARDTADVRLAVPFRYVDVGRAIGSLLDRGEIFYRLEGDVKFDAPLKDIRVPFDREGSFAP